MSSADNSMPFPGRRSADVGAVNGRISVDELLTRMRDGDRDAAATFLTRYGDLIRRRVRGKLSPTVRRIYDSHDILSSVGRQLDRYVRLGKLEAMSEGQLWALVNRMATHVVVDKSRVMRRLERVEHEDGPFAQELLRRLRVAQHMHAEEVEIERALSMLPSDVDREILLLWLNDQRLCDIAVHLDMTAESVRKRWQSIRSRLHDAFTFEAAS